MVGHTLVAGESSHYCDRRQETLLDLVSAMTPYRGDLEPALSMRAVSPDSVHTPSALGGDTAIRTFKCKTAKAATGIGAAFSVRDSSVAPVSLVRWGHDTRGETRRILIDGRGYLGRQSATEHRLARRANENASSHSNVGLQMCQDVLRDLLGRLARRKVSNIL
jgi:hypothetical protein